MPQLSLYITDENLRTLRERASEEGVSLSKYTNDLIKNDADNHGWPVGFWDLYGAVDDPSFVLPEDPIPVDDDRFATMFA